MSKRSMKALLAMLFLVTFGVGLVTALMKVAGWYGLVILAGSTVIALLLAWSIDVLVKEFM